MHLKKNFDFLKANNIFIKSIKSFIEYLFVLLFEQHVNLFDLITNEQKIKVIADLRFSNTLDQWKTYLNFTD